MIHLHLTLTLKRVYSLTILCIISTCFASAHDFKVNGIYYNKTNSKEVAVTYEGNYDSEYSNEYSGTVTIPSKVTCSGTTYSVTSIGSYAFRGCSSLTSITIPNSVTSIGNYAFDGCTGLTSITIPNTVTSIGNYAFKECSSLKSITIPNNVTSIGKSAFSGCTGLTTLNYNAKNATFSASLSFPGSLKNVIIGDGVKSIPSYFVYGCTGLKSITIPNSVTSIDNSAFDGCTGLTSITIPNSVTSIDNSAFDGCTGLTSITIPNSVTSIGNYAFDGCTGLTSITIPNSVTSIGNYAFDGCTGLTSITIPNSVTSIASSTFDNCTGLTSFTIPNSVTSIGSRAFSGCTGLTSITIPNNVTSIGEVAFSGCTNLTTMNYNAKSATVSTNSSSPSFPATLKTVNIGDGVQSIPSYFLSQDTILTSITIPNNVTSIGSYAFYNCTGLTSITIGNSVESIASSAFSGCTGLTTLNYNAKDATVSESFPGSLKNVIIGDGVKTIPCYFLYYCTGLTSITIPNSVTSIGSRAFQGCSGITSITIGNSVKYIGSWTFYGCNGLTSITIPSSVTEIAGLAFYGCHNLTTLNYNAKSAQVSSMSAEPSFSREITTINIGDSVDFIPSYFGNGCYELTSITIPESVTHIGNYAFYNCTKLQDVTCKNTTPPSAWSTSFSTYGTLHVPFLSKSKYESNSPWSKFTIKTLPVPVPITTLKFESDRVVMKDGNSLSLKVLYSPTEPTVTTFDWSSSDDNIATVSADGVVYAKKSGTAVIIAKTIDGTDISATCIVNVISSNRLWMKNDSVTLCKKTVFCPIYMDNRDAISNLQFDLSLPTGIDVAYEMNEDEEEDYVITKGERAKTAHTVSVQKNGERNCRVTITSTSNATFKDDDKSLPVAYVKLDYSKAPAVKTADYKIYLKNMVLAHDSAGVTTKYTVDADTATLTIRNAYEVTAVSADTLKGTVAISGAYNTATKDVMNGSNAIFTATPKTNMRFVKWTENGIDLSTDNPLTLKITETRSLVAEFGPKLYKISFIADGKTVSDSMMVCGDSIVIPAAPEKEGYTFKSWGVVDSIAPAHDVTYTAVYEINKYIVRFVANGTDVYNAEQEYKSVITTPDAPEIDGYAFITWGDVASTVPTHDVTYTAEYVMIGDVITDGKLNIGDLTKLVGEILKNEGPSLDIRSFKKSDVLVDNTIDLGDYTRLVGKVLDADSVKSNADASSDYGFSMNATPDASDKAKSMLDVFMTNKETISAIQFDVCLSGNADVYYGKNADGDMAYLISKGERAKTNHAVSFKKLADGTYRVIVSSPKNDTFKETEASKSKPVASLTLDVSNVTAGTSANVEIKNVVLSHYDSTDGSVEMFYPQDISYSLNATTKGDVTGNGTVDKDDVDAVINVICGGEEFKDTSDVNGDGKVDVNDVNTVIGTICGDK